MPKLIAELAGALCIALASLGCLYTIAATFFLRRFAATAAKETLRAPAVTILKPLAGVSAGLYEDLRTFCDQDYSGPVQIVFSARDAKDPAVAIAQRLIAERQGSDIELVLRGSAEAANPKIANLAGLESRIRHEIVVLADADIVVTPDYLRQIALGVQEGAFIVIGAALGLDATTSLALATARRLRDAVVFLPGLLAWHRAERHTREIESAGASR
jgi:ceramide glucosyltransferase